MKKTYMLYEGNILVLRNPMECEDEEDAKYAEAINPAIITVINGRPYWNTGTRFEVTRDQLLPSKGGTQYVEMGVIINDNSGEYDIVAEWAIDPRDFTIENKLPDHITVNGFPGSR